MDFADKLVGNAEGSERGVCLSLLRLLILDILNRVYSFWVQKVWIMSATLSSPDGDDCIHLPEI